MCEFCVSHGEGKKWYENMANYSEEIFQQVNSEGNLKHFLSNFGQSMKDGFRDASKWKKRLPTIYKFLIYPWLSKRQKATHFGQILPIEDVEHIIDQVKSIVRLPCICRKINTGNVKRYCYAVGLDMTQIFKDQPDFCEFDRISKETAKEEIRALDQKGFTHSVWTFQTPFIGAICNCDHDCMAYKVQYQFELAQVMWKGEYVAEINWELCNGCRKCQKKCNFDAIQFDRIQQKCHVDLNKCYGCGICQATCKDSAISLLDRHAIPIAANSW